MLHDISIQRRALGAGRTARTALNAGDVRINPWLLWRPERPQPPVVLTVAELAECHCPDFCNRDHVNE